MSVLIKNMKIPKNCDDCPMFDDHYDYPYCNITSTCQGYKWSPLDQRMSNCPLIEIPPHGRLIDVDTLINDGFYTIVRYTGEIPYAFTAMRIADAPTIIEADESDMDSFIHIFEEDGEEDEEDGMDSFIHIFKD